MPAYLTKAQFALRSIAPAEYIDAIELRTPGWIDQQLLQESARLDARLKKRYAAPFVDGAGQPAAPELVMLWLTRIVTLKVYLRRGVDATDEQFVEVRDDARAAEAELKEAADGAMGLWDLPVRGQEQTSAITYGGPRVYSEQSPYVWTDVQADIARGEDRSGRGT